MLRREIILALRSSREEFLQGLVLLRRDFNQIQHQIESAHSQLEEVSRIADDAQGSRYVELKKRLDKYDKVFE